MTFRKAVDATTDLAGAWQLGLRALGSDSRHVTADDPRTLAGSVNIDERLKVRRKKERQWDYAVGYKPNNRRQDVVYWVEVHPAHDHEIKVVQAKLNALLDWLRESAPMLRDMDSGFVWVSSGATAFSKGAKQVRQLADAGLIFKGPVFRIPDQYE